MRRIMDEAERHVDAWWRGRLTALELEAELVELGFYNVEFPPRGAPCRAAYVGVMYAFEMKGRAKWAS